MHDSPHKYVNEKLCSFFPNLRLIEVFSNFIWIVINLIPFSNTFCIMMNYGKRRMLCPSILRPFIVVAVVSRETCSYYCTPSYSFSCFSRCSFYYSDNFILPGSFDRPDFKSAATLDLSFWRHCAVRAWVYFKGTVFLLISFYTSSSINLPTINFLNVVSALREFPCGQLAT